MAPIDPTKPEKPTLGDLLPDFSIKAQLEKLRDRLPKKSELLERTANLLAHFDDMNSQERQKEIATIFQLSALVWLLADKQREEEAEAEEETRPDPPPPEEQPEPETPEQNDKKEPKEGEERKETEDEARKRRRKVRCDKVRTCLIQTDPAGDLRPDFLRLKPEYLCEYGVPEYLVFKEEMISILAPNEKDEEAAMKKVIAILQRSPMGKYQCMPQYLFQYVSRFKEHNFKWFKEWEGKQLEEKLHAMWEFLQDEKIQREACRGYVRATIAGLRRIPGFNNDPRYVRAAYYGGSSAGEALLARDLGNATEAQAKRVAKKQGDYISIESYAGEAEKTEGKLKQYGPIDVEALIDSIAARESGAYEGKNTKPRDETWENDQRFAYNRNGSSDEQTT